MNNIEKLAIEHVQFNGDCEGHELYCFTKEQLEAFAKALQSSEPVADIVEETVSLSRIKFKKCDFTVDFIYALDGYTSLIISGKKCRKWASILNAHFKKATQPVAYLKRKKMSQEAIELLPNRAMKNVQREKGWSDWYVIKAKDSCDDWLHDYETIPLFTHQPATVQSEPVADAIYEIHVGLGNWQEVSKSEYDASKSLNKRALVTANANDFCYAELKDIYDEMYQHKDIARVANRLYKLIHSRTHPPASVPLEKYNKLLDALREISNIELANRFGGNSRTEYHANSNKAKRMQTISLQAIAEAEGKV